MDYKKALAVSPKPYYTLAMAFADITGRGLDTRLVQRLIKQYTAETVLDAIFKLRGRNVEKPEMYLMGVLRNMTTEPVVKVTKPLNVEFIPNTAKLGNPFHATAV